MTFKTRPNLVGHIFKIVAFFGIYHAILETVLRKPYAVLFRDLQQRSNQLAQEVAERRQVEETLRTERDRAQHYLDVAGVMLIAIDTRGRVTLINDKGCEILGYGENEIIGQNWFETFLPQSVAGDVRAVGVPPFRRTIT
jgi:PAS domain-containing protein